MQFYKILRQRNLKEDYFYNLLDSKKYEFLIGNYSNSFAIKYTPETYNDLLNDNIIFRAYRSRAIQQLFVTNQKYLTIINYNNLFNMKMVECLFDEDRNSEYLEEFDELSFESVKYVVDSFGFNIKEVTYITNESNRLIVLQKNGVIGIDNDLTESEYQNVLKFIDTLNLGLKVIEK